MIFKKQLRDLTIRVLNEYGLYSEAATNLVMGTAAQESRRGTYIRQKNGGPARGIHQVEPATFYDLRNIFKNKWPEINNIEFEELEYNIKYSILFCRLKYLTIPKPLPLSNDVEGMAHYWKKYYNTYLGAGTEEEFTTNYRKYA